MLRCGFTRGLANSCEPSWMELWPQKRNRKPFIWPERNGKPDQGIWGEKFRSKPKQNWQSGTKHGEITEIKLITGRMPENNWKIMCRMLRVFILIDPKAFPTRSRLGQESMTRSYFGFSCRGLYCVLKIDPKQHYSPQHIRNRFPTKKTIHHCRAVT